MLRRVVHVLVVVQADLKLGRRLRDRQRAVHNRDVVVVRHHRLAALDHHVVLRRDRARVGVRFGALGAELNIVSVSAHKAFVLAAAHFDRADRDLAARVLLRLALAGEGHRTLLNRQCTSVRSHSAVVVRIADRVGVGIVLVVALAVVFHAGGGRIDRHRVVSEQREQQAISVRGHGLTVVRYRVHLVGVRLAIVGPAHRRGGDHKSLRARRNCQRAIVGRILVVRVGRLDLVADRPDVRDAGHSGAPGCAVVGAVLNRGAFGHTRRRAAIMRVAVILAAVIDRSDRHGRLIDRQVSFNIINSIVVGRRTDRCSACLDLIYVNSGIGLLAAQGDARQSVAALQAIDTDVSIKAFRIGARGPLRTAVIGVGLRLGRDRQRRRRDRQLHRIAHCPHDCVVGVCVTAICRYRLLLVIAHVVAGHNRGYAVAELARVKARIAACGRERTFKGLFVAVVHLFGAVAVDRDVQRRRRDLQPAVRNADAALIGNARIVRNGNGKAVGRQPHRVAGVGIDIRSLGLGCCAGSKRDTHAVGRGGRPIAVADLVFHRVAAYALLAAAVGLGIGIAGHSDDKHRLPHGIDIFVGLLLIGRDISGDHAVGCLEACAVPDQEVSGSAALGLRPADKLEALAGKGRGRLDDDRLVDLHGGSLFKHAVRHQHRVDLNMRIGSVVLVPPDMCRSLVFDVVEDRLEPDQVVCLGRLGVRLVPGDDRALSVVEVERKGRAGEDRLRRILPSTDRAFDHVGAVPVLDDPVRELLAVRDLGRSGQRGHRSLVDIAMVVLQVGVKLAAGIHILDTDALRAVDDLAPLAVDVKALGDPETRRVLNGVIVVEPAVDAVGLRGRVLVIVGRRDVGVVEDIAACVEGSREARIEVPAGELIAVARAEGRADRSAVVDTEAHDLVVAAPAKRRIRGRHVRLQERADLRAVPLGVDRHAVDRHRVELIGRRAGLVDVPAREGIALLRGLEAGIALRIKGIVVELGDVLLIRDLLADARAARELVVRGRVVGVDRVVAGIAGAVKEGDVVLRAQIVEIRRAVEERRSVVRLELRSCPCDIYRSIVRNIIRSIILILVCASHMRHVALVSDQDDVILFKGKKVELRVRSGIQLEINTVKFHRISIAAQRFHVEIDGLSVLLDSGNAEGHVLPWHDLDDRQGIITLAGVRVPAEERAVLRSRRTVVQIAAGFEVRRNVHLIVIRDGSVERTRIAVTKVPVSIRVFPMCSKPQNTIMMSNRNINAVDNTILRSAVAVCLRILIEGQRVLVAVVVDVDDGVAGDADGPVAEVVVVIGEAAEMIRIGRRVVGDAVDDRVGVAAAAGMGHGGDAADGRAWDRDRLDEVVAVEIDILRPDQHGVGRRGICDPVRVEVDVVRKAAAELIGLRAGFERDGIARYLAIGAIGIGDIDVRFLIPAAEGVTLAEHRAGILGVRLLVGALRLDELRGLIGRALALVEDKPVAGGQVDAEGHVAAEGDRLFILIEIDGFAFNDRFVSVSGIAVDLVAAALDDPALEVVAGVGRDVGHVHHVVRLGGARVAADRDLVRAESHVVLVEVGHVVRAE